MKFGPKEIKELNEYLRTGRNRKREFVADLVDDLEPGSLKDELLKDFDPSQETYEEYLQRKNLERPFNMADGGRAEFAEAGLVVKGPNKGKYFLRYKPKGSEERVRKFFNTNEELQNFLKTRPGYVPPKSEILQTAKDLKKKLGRLPTQTEVAKEANIAIQTVKNRLDEGVDFAKPLTKLEAAKLGGRKIPDTAVSKVSDNLLKKYKNLKQIHVSPLLATTTAGSKIFRVNFTGPIANDFKDFS